jgi:hypothetical protein
MCYCCLDVSDWFTGFLTGIFAANVLTAWNFGLEYWIFDWSTGFLTGISAEYVMAACTFLTGLLEF